MKIASAFPSKYLRAGDIPVGREVRVQMDFVQLESMEQSDDEKPVLYFIDKRKGLVLNRTNATTIEVAYGGETDNWHGKDIVLFATTTMFGGRQVPCLRLSVPRDLKTEAKNLPGGDDIPF